MALIILLASLMAFLFYYGLVGKSSLRVQVSK